MEGQLGLSELSVISWVSTFEGCPLDGVPLYYGPSIVERFHCSLLWSFCAESLYTGSAYTC